MPPMDTSWVGPGSWDEPFLEPAVGTSRSALECESRWGGGGSGWACGPVVSGWPWIGMGL